MQVLVPQELRAIPGIIAPLDRSQAWSPIAAERIDLSKIRPLGQNTATAGVKLRNLPTVIR